MWSVTVEPIRGGRQFRFVCDSRVPTYADFLQSLKNDREFRAWFNRLLADAPYAAFRWETPGVSLSTLTRPFEFVLWDAPGLDRQPDADAFAEHFRAANSVVSVWNLSGDALLVIPAPRTSTSAYPHLAAFVRNAPENQQDALWQLVAQSVLSRVALAPVWLSTAGAGVAWLHVRLDSIPKYYGCVAYRETPEFDGPP